MRLPPPVTRTGKNNPRHHHTRPQDALYHWKVTSAARQAFLETRGYPKNHGAGQTCRTVIQALMARVQDGAGNIMLRLSRVKVR